MPILPDEACETLPAGLLERPARARAAARGRPLSLPPEVPGTGGHSRERRVARVPLVSVLALLLALVPAARFAPPAEATHRNATLPFGTVQVGSYADGYISMCADGGGGVLEVYWEGQGRVMPDRGPFHLFTQRFNLNNGECQNVYVRFQPLTGGDYSAVLIGAGPGDTNRYAVLGSGQRPAPPAPGIPAAWGDNDSGQVGDGTSTDRLEPTEVGRVALTRSVAGGAQHSLAVGADGRVWAWGDNTYGQLGDGTTTGRTSAVRLSDLTNVSAIAAGAHSSVALRADGTVWSWGRNHVGQLGDGTTADRATPVQVRDLAGIVAVAAGSYHVLALRADGTVWAWGDNSTGQLGTNSTVGSSLPVQVAGLSGAVAVAAGHRHSMALKAVGAVLVWGSLPGTSSLTPMHTADGMVAIASGREHVLALDGATRVWAWGDNANGELGDGSTTTRTAPVLVSGLSGVSRIAAGENHSLALAPEGIWAWGDNSQGQLGNGMRGGTTTPTRAAGVGGVLGLTAGLNHSLAVLASDPWPDVLSVSKSGQGTGSVSSTPAGIVCGADCTESYPSGTVVTLHATRESGSDFAGWSGACLGTTNPCVMTMPNIDTVATATFVRAPWRTVAIYNTGILYNEPLPTLKKVVAADLNGDLRADLVHVRTEGEKVVFYPYLSNGTGGFTRAPVYNTGTLWGNPDLSDVLAADVNGDRRVDLIHVRTDADVLLFIPYLSDGTGGFTAAPVYSTGDQYNERLPTLKKVVAADLNRDGRADLIHVRTEAEQLILIPHLSNGAGGFTRAPTYRTNVQAAEGGVADVLAADLNGDGRQDLVHVRTNAERLIVNPHLSNGAGGFTPLATYQTGVQFGEGRLDGVLMARLTGDGFADTVHYRTDSALLLFNPHLGNGAGGFTAATTHQTGVRYNEDLPTLAKVLAADFNADGLTDLVHVRTEGEKVVFYPYLSNGAGGFVAKPPYNTLTLWGNASFADVLAADVSGDRRADLVHVRTDNDLVLFIPHLSQITPTG